MKIFISYSRADAKDTANQIYNFLTEYGHHEVFIDTKNIAGGEEWSNVIENEISQCDRFVIILTLSSINRPEVKKEINLAVNRKKMIIPCIHNSIEIKKIPSELNKYHGIQFEEGPELGRKLLAMINVEEKTHHNNEEKSTITNISEEKQNVEQTVRSVQTYLKNAKVFERLKQYQKALRNYDQAIKLDPDNFEILFPKALLLYKRGQFEEALHSIERAIDLQPENPDVWYHKASILDKMERYEESIEALDSSLLIDNKNIKSWTSKATLLENMKKYEEAIDFMTKF